MHPHNLGTKYRIMEQRTLRAGSVQGSSGVRTKHARSLVPSVPAVAGRQQLHQNSQQVQWHIWDGSVVLELVQLCLSGKAGCSARSGHRFAAGRIN